MAIVAKSELAEILRVSRARVSQFLKMGLPVRADGKIDLDVALNWVAGNVEPDADCGGAGVVARELLRERTAAPARRSRQPSPSWRKGAPPIPGGLGVLEKIKNPAEAMAVLALLSALMQIGAKASLAAHGAGASREIAERAGQLFTVMFVTLIEEFVADHDILDPAELTFPHPKFFNEVAWETLGPPGELAKKAADERCS